MLRNRVREFRDTHGWTQEELAERSGIGRQVIAALEAQPGYMPSMTTAVQLCRFLRCDLGRLFWIDWAAVEPVTASRPEEVAV